MLKFAALAAVATVSVLAAAPASAQDSVRVVRIAVAGKSQTQIQHDIEAAAATVCVGESADCVAAAVRNAQRQLSSFMSRQQAPGSMRVVQLQGGIYAVRVSLKDRSAEQVKSDIQAAAVAVCKPAGLARLDYAQCVDGAVRTAKEQLRAKQQLASN